MIPPPAAPMVPPVVPPPVVDAPVANPPVDPDPARPVPVPLLDVGGTDSDRDGLTNRLEQRIGLDPESADTDGDRLPDGYEVGITGTDPRQSSTDGDPWTDAFQIAMGLDPRVPDSDKLDGNFAVDPFDPDRGGLGGGREQTLGFDPERSDTDDDGFCDQLELRSGSDPMDPHSSPLTLVADPLQPHGGYAGPGT
jgi:hypothetical protein